MSYIVLIYAQGYQYSFKEGKFIRSGALYINVNTSASILIDDKLKTSTSLLGNSASIGGLLPATLHSQCSKEGWSSWQKLPSRLVLSKILAMSCSCPKLAKIKKMSDKEIHDLLYPVVASSSVSPSPSRSPRQHQLPKKLNLIPRHRQHHCRPPIEASRIIWMRARFI